MDRRAAGHRRRRTLADLGERLLGGVLSTVVVLLTAVGVLTDGERIVRRVRAIVPPGRQAGVDAVSQIVYESFGSYFAGSLLVAVLNGLVILRSGWRSASRWPPSPGCGRR